MKKSWAFALLLFCGGCLPAPAPLTPTPAEIVVPAPESAPLGAAAVSDLAPDVVPPSAAFCPPPGPDEPGDEMLDEEVAADEEAADPETVEDIEDIEILTGDDQVPPEDEGQTVTAEVSFDFPVVKNDKVLYFVDYYSGPAHKVFKRWLERSARYLPMMRQVFADAGLPQDLAYLAMIESGFNNRAYSWAHAAGPWQFIEGTGRLYGLDNDWWRDERRDPVKATRAAARHLKDLYACFDGDWYLAVAAYNAGSGKIRRAIEKYESRDFWELSHGSYLQTETKNYLPKLLATLLIAKEPGKYGFDDLEYLEPLAFETVTLPTTTDLEIIARLSAAGYDEIKELNPELKRWCTPPGVKNYEARIPAGRRAAFLEQYALIPENRRASYQRHRIKAGDTLQVLARRYGIRVADIVSLNKISNPRALRIGTDLILPLHKGASSLPVAELRDDYQKSHRQSYKVRSGDSLWKIARRFGVSEKELRVWNRLGWNNLIRPGQTLVVSAPPGKGKSVKNSTRSVAKKSAGTRKIVYQVRPGDTLFGIGRQFKVATRQIMDWNNLSEGHILQPGDRLTLLLQGDRRS